MIKSKEWNWEIVKDDDECYWKNPSIESYYLLNRWKSQDKVKFLDLGCGIGRHSVLFGRNGFQVFCFDLSEDGVNKTKEWGNNLGMNFDCQIGDMLNLPYDNDTMDCILCYNVISHSDTEGVKRIINEIKRVLRMDGECYLTLCSKETWGFKQDWPIVDKNTKLRMEEGPEYEVPHFYADYQLIKELFKDFKIVFVNHLENFYEKDNKTTSSYHYHTLIKKI